MADRKAELALIVGGILAIVGTFMAFATVSGPGGSISVTGREADEASNYLLAGGLAILCAILLRVMSGATGRKVVAIIALVGVGFFGLYGAIADITSISDLAPAGSGVEASAGIGLYIVLIGSLLAVVGAVMSIKSGRVSEPTAPAAETV